MCSTLLWRQPLSHIADRSDKVGGPEWQVLCHCNHLHDPDSDNNNGGGHNMSTAPASCGLCTPMKTTDAVIWGALFLLQHCATLMIPTTMTTQQ